MCGNFPTRAADRRSVMPRGGNGRRRPQRHFASPLVAPDLHVMHDRHGGRVVRCSCVTGRPGDHSGGAGESDGSGVCMCVCVSGGGVVRRWLAGEGAELIAATGPGRYGVFVKMTSSCSIVTSLLLHLLSSSPASTASHSLPLCLCQPRHFANDHKFSKLRHRPSGTLAGPFAVHFKRAAKNK